MSEILQPQIERETRAFEQMRSRLGDHGMSLLDSQLQTWAELNGRQINSPLRTAFQQGDTRLPKGTLLHGLGSYGFSTETIKSVSEKGVLSGELVGVMEDSETHGCADFFRTPTDTTISDYFARANERVNVGNIRKQRGEKLLTRGVTIIVDAQADGMDTLLMRDGYRDSEMAAFVRPPSGRTAEDTAAILGGVPRGAIAGIVVSTKLLENPEFGAVLGEYFSDVPMFTQDGAAQQAQVTT
jgi:hypothetical protein